jgi:Bacteriophage protein gp37
VVYGNVEPRGWLPRVSVGCENCYAERTAKRLKAIGVKHYQDVLDHNGRWNGNVALAEHKLKEPLSWKTPQTIFVNSMGDLFHRDVQLNGLTRLLRQS